MLKRLGDMLGLVTDADNKMLARMTIAEVVDAHIQWKLKLQNYIDGKGGEEIDPIIFSNPDMSTTGKWTTLQASGNLSDYNTFFTLRAKMEQCHHLAGEAVKKVQEGDRAAAAAIIKDRFTKTSQELVFALAALDREQAAGG